MNPHDYIAIDPGSSGGIAYVDVFTNSVVGRPIPERQSLKHLLNGMRPVAIIEDVGGYVGGAGQPGSRMFNFGQGFGYIEGVLDAYGYKVIKVRPQTWQKHFNFGTSARKLGKTAWKNLLKSKAQELYPDVKVTLKTADALLLLKYGESL